MDGIKIDFDLYYLRSLSQKDNLDNYHKWMSDPLNNKFILSAKIDFGIEELRKFILDNNRAKNSILLGIFNKSNNQHIGNIKYDQINIANKSATMGILIGEREFRGIGLAGKVIISSLKWLNLKMDIQTILLGVDTRNLPAIKLYSKIGFKKIESTNNTGIVMNLTISEINSSYNE